MLSYSVTPLSAWFLLVFSLIAVPVALYSGGYFAHAIAPSRMATVGIGFNVMLGAVEIVFVAGDVITFLFAWELMTLATAMLVTTEHQERESRRAGYLYLVMSHIGTGCLLGGFMTLAAASDSLSLAALFAGNLVSGSTRDGFALALLGVLAAGTMIERWARWSVRRVATWGCGGELSSRTEYTATAFSKPLTMIFRAIYRPTRQVETLAQVSSYFTQEVRYRSEIEPTFERYVYGPLLRGVLRVANGMKVLQAGSLHAYLAYVLVLGVLLLVWLGGTK